MKKPTSEIWNLHWIASSFVWFAIAAVLVPTLASSQDICAQPPPGSPPRTWTVDSTRDIMDSLTLRCALTFARSGDKIRFDPATFPAAAPATIRLVSALPHIEQGELKISGLDAGVVIDGTALDPGTPGLVLASDGNRISDLWIVDMPGSGIVVLGNQNRIGTTGEPSANRDNVAGPPATASMIISGNGGHGILISGHRNIVMGTYVGSDDEGKEPWPNSGSGVFIDGGSHNTIGGGIPGSGNLISGNGDAGVFIVAPGADENRVLGNIIGMSLDETRALPNVGSGLILTSGPQLNRVGGTSGEANVIAANGRHGILISGGETS